MAEAKPEVCRHHHRTARRYRQRRERRPSPPFVPFHPRHRHHHHHHRKCHRADAADAADAADRQSKKRSKAVPDGYLCKLCSTPGHWQYECSLFVKKKKQKVAKGPRADGGADGQQRHPTAEDIAAANAAMPVIDLKAAPTCKCGLKCTARKNKKKENKKKGGYGEMFWWCPKKPNDETKCDFVTSVNFVKKMAAKRAAAAAGEGEDEGAAEAAGGEGAAGGAEEMARAGARRKIAAE